MSFKRLGYLTITVGSIKKMSPNGMPSLCWNLRQDPAQIHILGQIGGEKITQEK